MAIVMGTAGHIDHGKTSLVRKLTGIDCDRLEEEKRRGITIELGFAFCDLPGGGRLGIVDVPGHEKFVKNMVAGASGIDFVMLVVAADEGVMPQTREHLEICSLLGIKHGLVAVTKIDMVDPELLELAVEDIYEFLKGTFLEGAPLFPVSSQTGEGVDKLRDYIVKQEKELAPRRRTDLFRLPVDRVFTVKWATRWNCSRKNSLPAPAACKATGNPWKWRNPATVPPSTCKVWMWRMWSAATCWPCRERCSLPIAGWCG
jgi:selenocysteine-specific elongation factor